MRERVLGDGMIDPHDLDRLAVTDDLDAVVARVQLAAIEQGE